MQEILNLEAEKASLIGKLVNPAVVNTRRKVRSTFTPKVALRYKDYFDTAIQLGKSVKIKAADFPRINCNTIRQQANDALLYLIHHYHDTGEKEIEARYLRFRVMSKFHVVEDGVEILHGFEVKNSGVHREVVVQAMETSGVKASRVAELSKDEASSVLGIAPTNDDQAWRMELIDWLNDPKDITEFRRTGVFKNVDMSFVSGLADANDLINESNTGELLIRRRPM